MKIRMRHLAVSGCLAVLATTGSLTAAAADGPSPAGPALHHTGQSPPMQTGGPALGQDHGQQPWMQDRDDSPSVSGDGELPGHGHEETPGPRSGGGTTPSDAPSHPTGHGDGTPHTPSAHTPSHTHTPKPSSTPPAETPTPTPPHTPTPSTSDNGVPTLPTTPATSTPSTRPRPPELAETGDASLWMLAAVAVAAMAAGAGCLVLGRRAGR